ncbi:MAG: nicotinamide mononucleotide transporter [Ruminococcaceae bacterium]|nr:nicotinamide mononucleotide transporter [Oscillospiraceae bacterium]
MTYCGKIKKFMIDEFAGWKVFDYIWIFIASAVILGLSLYWEDDLIGITSALTGVWCVILTGNGKRSSFIFGMVNVLCYIFISWKASFYGEVMLNALYYVPMNVVGWIAWTRHMNQQTAEVKKKSMKINVQVIVYALTLLSIFAYGFILKLLGGNLPFIDSMSTMVSIVAQILSVKRYTEQWVLWIVVDIVSVIMWGINFARGGESIATLAMWSVYLVNAIIMYLKWRKEAKNV